MAICRCATLIFNYSIIPVRRPASGPAMFLTCCSPMSSKSKSSLSRTCPCAALTQIQLGSASASRRSNVGAIARRSHSAAVGKSSVVRFECVHYDSRGDRVASPALRSTPGLGLRRPPRSVARRYRSSSKRHMYLISELCPASAVAPKLGPQVDSTTLPTADREDWHGIETALPALVSDGRVQPHRSGPRNRRGPG
jgi:hypothetical protein